jgi:hypothetical protein
LSEESRKRPKATLPRIKSSLDFRPKYESRTLMAASPKSAAFLGHGVATAFANAKTADGDVRVIF